MDRAHIPGNAVVALCDSNEGRVKLYNRLLQELGQPVSISRYHPVKPMMIDAIGSQQRAAEYSENDFEKMLDEENVEVLVVTTVDATHDRYISRWTGCYPTRKSLPFLAISSRAQAGNQGFDGEAYDDRYREMQGDSAYSQRD